MVADINKYYRNKEYVCQLLTEHRDDLKNSIAFLSVSTMVPCIVIAYWAGELFDWPVEVVEKIKNLIEFYGYTEVVGKPVGSPI